MSNVVSLFNRNARRTLSGGGNLKTVSETSSQIVVTEAVARDENSANQSNVGLTFLEIAERNRANQERIRKERDQANKGVLKSYRIK